MTRQKYLMIMYIKFQNIWFGNICAVISGQTDEPLDEYNKCCIFYGRTQKYTLIPKNIKSYHSLIKA